VVKLGTGLVAVEVWRGKVRVRPSTAAASEASEATLASKNLPPLPPPPLLLLPSSPLHSSAAFKALVLALADAFRHSSRPMSAPLRALVAGASGEDHSCFSKLPLNSPTTLRDPARSTLCALTRPLRALSAPLTATAMEADRRRASPRAASHARAYPLSSADSASSRELAWAAVRRALWAAPARPSAPARAARAALSRPRACSMRTASSSKFPCATPSARRSSAVVAAAVEVAAPPPPPLPRVCTVVARAARRGANSEATLLLLLLLLLVFTLCSREEAE
jgi:hypothetical protein